MDPELVARLAGPEGRLLFERIGPYAAADPLALTTRLRAQGHPPELVAAALAQARLRAQAADKFGEPAAGMFFTADGLEQATRPELAAGHAERYAAAGVERVHDLGCGIGADAMALAQTGLGVDAFDADPVTAAVAAANLSPWPGARVTTGRAEQVSLPVGSAARHTGVWVDPARRVSGVRDTHGRARRLWSLDAISPSWAQVQVWAAGVPATGAKLAPAFPHGAIPAGVEAQWTSWRGDVLECAVWWGPLVRVPGRTAAVCRPGSPTVVVTAADVRDEPALGSLDELGPWLLEADRAVVRAGLSSALPGRELSAGVGYASADSPSELPWLRSYAVIEAMSLRPKAIRAWLRARGMGSVTIKKRGTSIAPEALRRELTAGLRGLDGHATLVVTTLAGSTVVIVVGPADPPA